MLNSCKWFFALSAGVVAGTGLAAAEHRTEVVTTTTTVVTKKVVKEKTEWSPFRVCVLDFSSLDILGQKRFLDERNREIRIPAQSTLNDADRKSVNGFMQGIVRMIDAWDNSKTNTENRRTQTEDNRFDRAKALALYDASVKGEARPMVAGAEYLSAFLGRHNDVFSCLDTALVAEAMRNLRNETDFPKDFMLRLARKTGATHLISGVVSDLRTKSNSFKGYGIETKTTTFQLDVIIKMVDLAVQRTVYSNVYTGNYREQRPISGTQFDNNIYQSLMTSALEQAAEDLYDRCRPGRKNRISVTPLPWRLSVVPSGGMFFKPAEVEIFVDGERVGSGACSFMVPAGRHTLAVSAPGYKTKTLELKVAGNENIHVKLEK